MDYGYQGQGGEDGNTPGAGGAPQQGGQMGQPIESMGGGMQPGGMMPGGQGGEQPGGDSKTTLWYALVVHR